MSAGNDEAPRRRERDAVEIRGDYQARALESRVGGTAFLARREDPVDGPRGAASG